jgi:hypothetical protein
LRTFFAGTVGFTTKMMSLVAMGPTGAKSRSGSNGSFAYVVALIAKDDEMTSSA